MLIDGKKQLLILFVFCFKGKDNNSVRTIQQNFLTYQYRLQCLLNKWQNCIIINLFSTPSGRRKGPIKQGLSILLPVWEFSLNFIINFFLNFGMVIGTHVKLCVAEPDFLRKFFCPQIWEN